MAAGSGRDLNLFFPQWQGCGDFSLKLGADCLLESFSNALDFKTVAVAPRHNLSKHNGINGYSDLLEQARQAKLILETECPQAVFTLGGDCGTALGPLSWLNRRYGGDLAVVWIDAHADLNTPASSPSANFHGMVLRTLLGDGDLEIVKQCTSNLSPDQLFLAGCRSLDRPEAEFIREKGIPLFAPLQLENGPDCLRQEIMLHQYGRLYVHLDLDVLDPAEFPFVKYPETGGLTFADLGRLLEDIAQHYEIAGFGITEALPGASQSISRICRLAEAVLGIRLTPQ